MKAPAHRQAVPEPAKGGSRKVTPEEKAPRKRQRESGKSDASANESES